MEALKATNIYKEIKGEQNSHGYLTEPTLFMLI